MSRSTEQFKLIRVDRTLYRFECPGQAPIQIYNPRFVGRLNQKCSLDVRYDGEIFSLTGTNTWPHDVRLKQFGLETMTTSEEKAVGSRCIYWRTRQKVMQIRPCKSDWIVGRHWAFHLWDGESHVCYWQQQKSIGNIEGVRKKWSDPLQIAVIAFGFMFDWESGSNWK